MCQETILGRTCPAKTRCRRRRRHHHPRRRRRHRRLHRRHRPRLVILVVVIVVLIAMVVTIVFMTGVFVVAVGALVIIATVVVINIFVVLAAIIFAVIVVEIVTLVMMQRWWRAAVTEGSVGDKKRGWGAELQKTERGMVLCCKLCNVSITHVMVLLHFCSARLFLFASVLVYSVCFFLLFLNVSILFASFPFQ